MMWKVTIEWVNSDDPESGLSSRSGERLTECLVDAISGSEKCVYSMLAHAMIRHHFDSPKIENRSAEFKSGVADMLLGAQQIVGESESAVAATIPKGPTPPCDPCGSTRRLK